MKPCFNTITAGRHRQLEEIILSSGEVGFDALEIDQNHITESLKRISMTELKTRIADAGLTTASIMAFDLAPLDEAGPGIARIKKGAEFAHELGAPLLLVYCATCVPNGMSIDEALRRAADRTAQYADIANPIAIGLEPIGRTTLMGGPAAALETATRSGRANVGIVIDTFHFHRSQVSQAELRAIPTEKLLLVHVNDAENLPIEKLRDEHRLHVGFGVLALGETFRSLQEIGYNGFLSIEIFRKEYWNQPVSKVVSEAKLSLDATLAKAKSPKG
jgi:2-keto-myo-inositol isomerase